MNYSNNFCMCTVGKELLTCIRHFIYTHKLKMWLYLWKKERWTQKECKIK